MDCSSFKHASSRCLDLLSLFFRGLSADLCAALCYTRNHRVRSTRFQFQYRFVWSSHAASHKTGSNRGEFPANKLYYSYLAQCLPMWSFVSSFCPLFSRSPQTKYDLLSSGVRARIFCRCPLCAKKIPWIYRKFSFLKIGPPYSCGHLPVTYVCCENLGCTPLGNPFCAAARFVMFNFWLQGSIRWVLKDNRVSLLRSHPFLHRRFTKRKAVFCSTYVYRLSCRGDFW